MTQQRINSMNANENNNANTIQNQEVYDGAKEVMLQEGVIPKEIIKRNEVIRKKKKCKKNSNGANLF